MHRHPRRPRRPSSARRALVPALTVSIALLVAPLPAAADAPPVVDESRLQPALSAGFGPWTCQAKKSGPVCKGEFHFSGDWTPFDFTCGDREIWSRGEVDRFQTRYYNTDYLDFYREFRTTNIDYLATTPDGPATGTITTRVRFHETFAVPGDDRTRTIISRGVLWDIRPVDGPSAWRAVGTLIETPDAVGTFSGLVTDDNGTTRYEDAPLPEVLSDDTFVGAVCAAATGGG